MKFNLKNIFFQLSVLFSVMVLASNVYAWGAKELENEKDAITFAGEVERGGYRIVSTEQLKKLIDEKKEMTVVDTMPYEASYKKNHIPGALQFELPIAEMNAMDAAQKTEFAKLLGSDKSRKLIFYCGFTKCTRSHNGAMWAVKLGYNNVFRHPGGIKAWKEAEYPIEQVK